MPLKEGLEECVALLAPREPGSTLVLSSLRSESVKGFVTRVGTKLVKGVSCQSIVFTYEYEGIRKSYLFRHLSRSCIFAGFIYLELDIRFISESPLTRLATTNLSIPFPPNHINRSLIHTAQVTGHKPPPLLPRPQCASRHANLPINPPQHYTIVLHLLHIHNPRTHPHAPPQPGKRPLRRPRRHRRHSLDRPSHLRALHRRTTNPTNRPSRLRAPLSQGPESTRCLCGITAAAGETSPTRRGRERRRTRR